MPPSGSSALVSVVVPVYNGETYIGEAIDSILRQGNAPIEIVVVDDGSTDRSAAIAREAGVDVRVISQPHRGLPAARNHGLLEARGTYVGFLDCDDVWTEHKLAVQLEILGRHLEIAVVLGHTRRMWTSPCSDGVSVETRLDDPVLALNLGAALIRRSVFDVVGRFDEAITHSHDWDWFMRARELEVVLVVHDEVTVLYRRHGGNMTNQWPESMTSFAQMIQKSIARRRSQGPATSLPPLLRLDEYLGRRRTRTPGGSLPSSAP
jgi:glycosyltransferase involved in cell wall biosynthesis